MNIENETKLAKTSRRKPGNEAQLLWLVLGIIFYYGILAKVNLFKIAALGISPFGFTIGAAAIASGIIAYIYYRHTGKKVRRAVVEYNLLMRHQQAKIKTAHIEALKQRQIKD